MKRLIFLSVFFISLTLAQTYCAGDQVSLSHQNQEHVVGGGIEGYPEGSMFKLADWNGTVNNGDYKVIWLEMSASW